MLFFILNTFILVLFHFNKVILQLDNPRRRVENKSTQTEEISFNWCHNKSKKTRRFCDIACCLPCKVERDIAEIDKIVRESILERLNRENDPISIVRSHPSKSKYSKIL